jgi:hypothetical protein
VGTRGWFTQRALLGRADTTDTTAHHLPNATDAGIHYWTLAAMSTWTQPNTSPDITQGIVVLIDAGVHSIKITQTTPATGRVARTTPRTWPNSKRAGLQSGENAKTPGQPP